MAKSKKNSVSSMRKSKRKVKDEYYREYLPTFFDTKVEDFNIKSRSINWGMGLEHEVQFFHINNKKSKVPFFDSSIIDAPLGLSMQILPVNSKYPFLFDSDTSESRFEFTMFSSL